MILADKIIHHRKLLDLTQEELAEKLNVSRQSISKWEGALSIPDMNKIILLSEVFGVSIDYLLKDDIESTEAVEDSDNHKILDLETVNNFLDNNLFSSKLISTGVSLCILSPLVLIHLTMRSEVLNTNETQAAAVGLMILIPMVAVAVGLFIKAGMTLSQSEFLEHEVFELAYGVESVIRKRKDAFHETFTNGIIIGVMLIILSVVPLFVAQFYYDSTVFLNYALSSLLIFVAIGVHLLVRVVTIQNGFDKLLQLKDYTIENKRRNKIVDTVASIYWPLVTAVYLYISFTSSSWHKTWIIWPVAGTAFAVIAGIVSLFSKEV